LPAETQGCRPGPTETQLTETQVFTLGPPKPRVFTLGSILPPLQGGPLRGSDSKARRAAACKAVKI
jgi:hypothetical protein